MINLFIIQLFECDKKAFIKLFTLKMRFLHSFL